MGTPDPITGKVAAIIDDTTLVLNVGSCNCNSALALFRSIVDSCEILLFPFG